MPAQKSVWEAAMLLAVAVAFPWTISLLGTYRRAKAPGMEMSTYSKPTNLPGFLAELMCPRVGELSLRYGGGGRKVTRVSTVVWKKCGAARKG